MGLWDSQNGGGGTGGIADGVQTLAVANFAALPSAASHTDEIYYVQNSTGIYLINRKNKGFYKSDGVNWNPWEQDDLAMDALLYHEATWPHVVKQVVYAEITTSGTFANARIPFDDTLPQNTEGAELLTASITPQSAASFLWVEAQAFVGEDSNLSDGVAAALFRDSAADAVAADFNAYDKSWGFLGANIQVGRLHLSRRVASVAAVSTTFKVRIGLNTNDTVRYNGANGGRVFGGSLISFLKITEYV